MLFSKYCHKIKENQLNKKQSGAHKFNKRGRVGFGPISPSDGNEPSSYNGFRNKH